MERLNERYVVSIGTTHPWNIAGVGLDARVAAEYGLPHAAAIAAVSAQDARGLHAVEALPAGMIAAQLASLPAEVGAYRLGALVSAEGVRVVTEFLATRAGAVPIVVDPVLRASLGGALQEGVGLAAALLQKIVPLGVVLTPNIDEAGELLGIPVCSEAAMRAAGEAFVRAGASAAYMTGGHLDGDPIDVLVTATRSERLAGPRLAGSMRGSGCTLAASLACELARGSDIFTAAVRARAYVRAKIASAVRRGGLQVAF